MKFIVIVGVCLMVQLFNGAQAHPHRSVEDSEEETSETESAEAPQPVVIYNTAPPDTDSHERDMTSHENRSHQEEEGSSEEDMDMHHRRGKDDDDDHVRFPKTEYLCPARPEEITTIELECAQEYQLWKEQRARKESTTTPDTAQLAEMVEMSHTAHTLNTTDDMSDEMQMSTQEMTTQEMTTEEVTTEDETTTEMTTPMPSTTTTTRRPTTTTTTPMRRSQNNNSGRKHKRSTRRKRSVRSLKRFSSKCYPATCILKKLNLLDAMGQPSIKQIQKFAINMTVDDSTNLEKKAMECVKEINVAMIDASSDIGKKVGCVAQKVITCLNKGLTCPIMNVPQ